jgi:hypothetical protein
MDTKNAGVKVNMKTKLTLVATQARGDKEFETDAELSLYRDRTLALLRRYCQLSVELGESPRCSAASFSVRA